MANKGPEGWRKALCVGDDVDVMDEEGGGWLVGRVMGVEDDQLELHFVGRHNIWKGRDDEGIAFHGAHTSVAVQATAGQEAVAMVDGPTDRALRTKSGRAVVAGAEQHSSSSSSSSSSSATDSSDWLCTECSTYESPMGGEDDPLLLCDGGCLRSFHLSCLFLDEVPREERWLCADCTSGSHRCFACGDFGRDGTGEGEVSKCTIGQCGKFYHLQCVSALRHTVVNEETRKFKCPAHTCHTCEAKRGGGLVRCMLCPTAYHAGCCPPSVAENGYFLHCTAHADRPLPLVPASWRGDDSDDDSNGDDGEVLEDKPSGAGSLRFPKLRPKKMGMVREPNRNRQLDNHFRLLTSILTEVQSRPAPFKPIRNNIYLRRATRRVESTRCECTERCDEDCINRVMNVECVGCCTTDQAKKGSANSKIETNCNLGLGCGNRRLQNREYAKFELKRVPFGFGIVLKAPVREGDVVVEYVGEVVDEATSERRCTEHRRRHPRDPNFYIMALGPDEYIDARFKGNYARFINHSCGPNCSLKKWNVGGYTRIAIFAEQDLEAGTEVCYDYDFSTQEAAMFKCECGSARCRGSLSKDGHTELPSADDLSAKKLGKKERAELLKRARAKKRQLDEAQQQQRAAAVRRRSLTGAKLPGDGGKNNTGGGLVCNGPPPKHRTAATQGAVFLWRNAASGADFVQRAKLREVRHGSGGMAAAALGGGRGQEAAAAAAAGGAAAAGAASTIQRYALVGGSAAGQPSPSLALVLASLGSG